MPIAAVKQLKKMVQHHVGVWITYLRKLAQRCILYSRAWLNRRLRDGVTVVGITGSVGKTTTKDLCATVLSQFGPCVSSRKSENERFQVAETVLRMEKRHRFAVFELSGSKPGYLDFSLRMTRPRIAVLTVIGRDHFRAFKSIEAIAKEKGKLVAALPRDGVAVLNIDDPLIRAIGESSNRKVIWFGKSEGATLKLVDVRSSWPEPLTMRMAYDGELWEIRTQLHGKYLALSVLASLGVAVALGLPLRPSIDSLATVQASAGRMQVVPDLNGVNFVRDDWKAAHWSLYAPLDFMVDASAGRKIAVIGTISHLTGDSSSQKYKKIAREVRESVDLAVFVGPNAHRAARARRGPDDGSIRGFSEIRDAAAFLDTELQSGDLVLLKGTNSQDHLLRLLLNRANPIACWQMKCGRHNFCDSCNLLYQDTALEREATRVKTVRSDTDDDEVRGDALDARAGRLVLVGLGNPGADYDNTPHNIGFRVLDELVASAGGRWEPQAEGQVSLLNLEGGKVTVLKPGAFINLSGEPVQRFLNRLGVPAEHCVVVHDDTDLRLGEVRWKHGGGDVGHGGMRSVIAALRSGDFDRLRIGVRRTDDVRRARDLVRVPFSGEEAKVMSDAVGRALTKIQERVNDRIPGDSAPGAAVAPSTLAETALVASGRESGKLSNPAATLPAPNARER